MANKKTLYHSTLVKLSPVTVTVVKEAQASQFKDKPPFVTLKIDGVEQYYNCESQQCEDFFQGQQGRTFVIVAEGRDDSAIISYVGEAADTVAQNRGKNPPPPQQQQRKAQNNPPQNPPTQQRPNAGALPPKQTQQPETGEQKHHRYVNAVTSARVFSARKANMALIAYEAAMYFQKSWDAAHPNEPLPPEAVHGVATNIMISGSGMADTLPAGELAKYLPAPKQEPQQSEPSDNDGGGQ